MPAQSATLAVLFAFHCAACHGVDGSGRGPLSQGMTVPLPDFRSAAFQSTHSDAELLRSLTYGVRGSPMPPFDFLPLQSRRELVKYIRSLKEEKRKSR
jgi:mono/diheme cytochrome c family protein